VPEFEKISLPGFQVMTEMLLGASIVVLVNW
jgi:hypothetical protein